MPAPVPNFAHPAFFLQGHDGDSFWLRVDFGMNTHGVRLILPLYVRLYGVDAVELSSPTGPAAAGFTTSTLAAAARIVVQTIKPSGSPVGEEKYGRWLCRVWCDDDELADLVQAAGFEKT